MNYVYIDDIASKVKFNETALKIDYRTPSEIMKEFSIPNKGLIILCELQLASSSLRNELNGISLAQNLRRNGYKGGILFISFLSRKQVIKLKPEYSLINTIGHDFIQLPAHPQEWISTLQTIKPLDDLEWYDIERNYCNRLGTLRMELHALFGLTHDGSVPLKIIYHKLILVVKQVGELFQQPVDYLLKKIPNSIEEQSRDKIAALVKEINSGCQEIINQSVESAKLSKPLRHPWSALFLDDEIGPEHQLIQLLKKRGITVHCFSKAVDALHRLRQNQKMGDLPTLVLSDYRLEEDLNGVRLHQPMQGYTFLKQVAAMKNHISLAALSAMPRAFLLESFRHYGISVDIFSKKDYLESQHSMQLLANELIRKGELAFQTRIRLPRMSSPNWTLFEPFYQYHKLSSNYQANENYIALKAKNYCEEYLRSHHLFDLTGYKTTLAGKNKIPNQPKAFNDFLEKMVCRRVILWFTQRNPNKIYSPEEVLPFLKGRQFEGSESSSTAKNQVNTNLALRLTEFPWNATIEEKNWLIEDMSLPHLSMERVESEELLILNHIATQFNSFLPLEMSFSPNTFLRCKIWLSKARNNALTSEDRQDLQSLISNLLSYIWQRSKIDSDIIDLKNFHSRSVKDFAGYLERTKKFLQRIENTNHNQNSPKGLNVHQKVILKHAQKVFTGQPEIYEALESLAYLFLYEQRRCNSSYRNQSAWNKAFVSYCKKEGEYIDPYLIRLQSSDSLPNNPD